MLKKKVGDEDKTTHAPKAKAKQSDRTTQTKQSDKTAQSKTKRQNLPKPPPPPLTRPACLHLISPANLT